MAEPEENGQNNTVDIAAARWHQAGRHDQQVAAAYQTLAHLQVAYDEAAAQPLLRFAA
ncbi:hypothetical protein ACFYZB_39765 [Streptomyces sp. NPDC001852]|uniref:hypothetical protein n=1 Tax=Streptomyces sp. NPDC001852 TaxID=3364619 RepID=UPI00369A0382